MQRRNICSVFRRCRVREQAVNHQLMTVNGPYRMTRNPMYVGFALLTVAFALFLNTWWPMLLLGPTLLAVQRFVIVPEENYLRRRFGAEYGEYTHRVRRWV